MITRRPVPLVAARALIVLLATAAVDYPVVQAQAPNLLPDSVSTSIYSAIDLSQVVSARTGIRPQLQAGSTGDIATLEPETRGDLFMVRQQYLAAIDAYRQAPHSSAIVWNKLGIAYQHMYALDFAKLQYEKALSIDPKYAEAINNLGTVYYGEKNYRKAEQCYRKALHYKPQTASFYSNLGTAYFADRKYKQGAQSYQQAFALDPQIFIRESLERIAELGPVEEQSKLNYELAKIYAQAGNIKAALVYLRTALNEGFGDRKRLMADKELAALRGTQEFHVLMAEEHIN